jgi:Ca2+:H+ antiporter
VSTATRGRFSWTFAAPVAALVVLVASWGRHPGTVVSAAIAVFLVAAVLAAVHQAEVVAHRVGEPFGSLVLAVAVTVIEVGLILMLMLNAGGKDTSTLARDTVFAAVMISANGIVGLALLVGALRHHLANFNPEGTGSALATVITLASVTLVLPRFTTSTPGPEFSGPSSPSRRSARWRCTPSSCSPRPCGTATSSCPSEPTRTARTT